MSTVKIYTNVQTPIIVGRDRVVSCDMVGSQIKETIRSMLTVITDREWMEIIEELSPGVLEEMVLEKLKLQE